MLPLTYANSGQAFIVSKINGKEDIKKHLEDLGLVAGTDVEVVSAQAGNLIIKVKGSRLAITSEMAQRIMVEASLERVGSASAEGEKAIKTV